MRGLLEERPVLDVHICLHGKRNVGKTQFVHQLCNYATANVDELHSEQGYKHLFRGIPRGDTIGQMMYYAPFEGPGAHPQTWVIQDTGSTVSQLYKHLAWTNSLVRAEYNVHIVLFSMIDRKSFELAANITNVLRDQFGEAKCFVVGTHLDQFESFQVTDDDLHHMTHTLNVDICLMNLSQDISQWRAILESFTDVFEQIRALSQS